MTDVVPSREARLAYAEAYQTNAPKFAEDIAEGHLDYTPLCQAFARFEATIRADALEQAAKVAAVHGQNADAESNVADDDADFNFDNGRSIEAYAIAADISALIPAKDHQP